MATSLLIGGRDDRESAKRRRREEYKQDLELQMRERDAAKQRERMQDMSVDASGYLDPEKRPDRFKPLGGVHWTEQREQKTDRVRPYHTLFLYDKMHMQTEAKPPATPPHTRLLRISTRKASKIPGGDTVVDRPLRVRTSTSFVTEEETPALGLDMPRHRITGPTAGIHYHPATYAGAGVASNNAVDQAYNLMGAQDISYGSTGGRGGGGGGSSIVQPISIPQSNNRPVIVTGHGGGGEYYGPRFNPFQFKRDDASARDYSSLLILTQAEKDRIRRDNEDFQRRLRQDLEAERRRLNHQEAEARRRMEELRRQAEERWREAERQRREAERLRNEVEVRPQTDQAPRPSSKKIMLYHDMDDYKLRLIEERKKIEELLKAGKPVKEVWDLKVIPKERLQIPATPKTPDRANKDNVNEFNDLKYRDFNARNHFRSFYPDVPVTNKRLEQQQEALIRQQEANLQDQSSYGHPGAQMDVSPRRPRSRPSWLDRDPTPFPHVLRKRDQLYSSKSDTDMERIHRRIKAREKYLRDTSSPSEEAILERLKFRNHRPSSTDTLTDDTWLRPSSTAEV